MNYEIKRFLEEREIESLYHFTTVENLESILVNGLLSRERLMEKRLMHFYNDIKRLDRNLDAICTSIEFPNYKMFYSLRMNDDCDGGERSGNWCVIELDANILAEKECLFHEENAASRYEINKPDFYKQGIVGLERMFGDEEFRNLIGLKPYIPTNPQAEVQIFEDIEPCYIKAVHFEDTIVKNYLDKQLRNIYNKNLVEFQVTKELFYPRSDYRNWA